MTPLLFVSHGAPTEVLDADSAYAAALRDFAATARPRAVVVVSAHWQTRAPAVRTTGAARPPLIYDFGGFPAEMYRLQYAAPGDPALAREIAGALGAPFAGGVDEARGWDHGVWVPLKLMMPAADVPVVEVSLPTADAAALLTLGQQLAFLRARGVLLVGSGGAVHNLGEIGHAATPEWARAFDAWAADAVARHDTAALGRWQADAPWAGRAMPTSEHFDPLLVVAGAARADEPVRTLFEGFRYGSLSMRTLAIG